MIVNNRLADVQNPHFVLGEDGAECVGEAGTVFAHDVNEQNFAHWGGFTPRYRLATCLTTEIQIFSCFAIEMKVHVPHLTNIDHCAGVLGIDDVVDDLVSHQFSLHGGH